MLLHSKRGKILCGEKKGDRGPALKVLDVNRREKKIVVAITGISCSFNECLLDQKSNSYCWCCAPAFANATFSFTRNLYYEVMRTLVALVIIILYMLYTVAYVNIPLLWPFV